MAGRSSDPDALVTDAVCHLRSGDLAAAELESRSALAFVARHTSASTVLGAVLLAQERFAEAQSVFADLVEREPAEGPHWINFGNSCRGLREFDQALTAYARAAALGAKEADFYFNVGLTHLDRSDFESARSVLQQARQLDPNDAEIQLRFADACYRTLHNDAAAAALMEWRTFASMTPSLLAHIAQLLISLGQQQEGERAFEAALADPAIDSSALLIGITIAERTNRLELAQLLINRVEAAPHSSAISEDLLEIRARMAQRSDDHATAAQLYTQALLGNVDPATKHMTLFPLAQSLDALGRYDDALRTLEQAHASQLEYLRRTSPALVLTGAPPMLITRHGCDPDDVTAWRDEAPSVEDSPVFIVAFPRSGTTLLELILDAHPQLQSMDEQPFIQDALEEMQELPIEYPSELARVSQSSLDEMRANYWRRVAGKVELKPGTRLVDKNPLNILRLPVIRRLFPHASILFGVRHPCDVILSCYMQPFRAPEFALLCNSLATLVYGYRRTMDFWTQQSEILRPRARTVRYEDLVSNFEHEVRGIIQFLDLPWDEKVLQPGRRALEKGYISTPSYSQVVRPVSAESVNRWRHYQRLFAPIVPSLRAQLERWDYEAVVDVDGVSPNSR